MLATLLMLFGLAPQGADTNSCLMPTWAINAPQAIACDAKDIEATGTLGKRSGLTFKRSPKTINGMTLNYSIQSAGDAAQPAALLIGARGGYVQTSDTAISPANAWTATLSKFGIDPSTVPRGAVVFYTSILDNPTSR